MHGTAEYKVDQGWEAVDEQMWNEFFQMGWIWATHYGCETHA